MTARLSAPELDVLASRGTVVPAVPYDRRVGDLGNGLLPLRPFTELCPLAAAELRDASRSLHDHRVLAAIRDRLDGEERDLLERLLSQTAPRRKP